jgi:hypothetical protein
MSQFGSAFQLADSDWQRSWIVTLPDALREHRGSSLGRIGDAKYRMAALGALLVRADLTDPLEDIEFDGFLSEASERTADGVRCPTRGFSDCRPAGALR